MATRPDHLHSHQFMRARLVGALALRDANPDHSPTRGAGGALLAGVLVAALAATVVGAIAALRPGGPSWREAGAVIIERETGARYVYRDGVLYPVLNDASALLLLGNPTPARTLVARAALAGVARGPALGVPGAPDPLPAAGDLAGAAWSLCSYRGGSSPQSLLSVGTGTGTGTGGPLVDRALLAEGPGAAMHVLWHGRRYPVEEPDLVLAAFAWPRQAAVPVATAVLNAIPAGAPLRPPQIAGAGSPSSVEGLVTGQVVLVENQAGGRQYGVARPDGISEITQVQADLLLAGGSNTGGAPVRLSQAAYASAPRSGSLVPAGAAAPPARTPVLAGAAGTVCAAFAGAGVPELRLADPPAGAPDAVYLSAFPGRSGAFPAVVPGRVDWVVVPPGTGAVVESLASPTAPSGELFVVTDLGVAYPVPSRDVLAILGYGGVAPAPLPSALVALLPQGRPLDPALAAQPTADAQRAASNSTAASYLR